MTFSQAYPSILSQAIDTSNRVYCHSPKIKAHRLNQDYTSLTTALMYIGLMCTVYGYKPTDFTIALKGTGELAY